MILSGIEITLISGPGSRAERELQKIIDNAWRRWLEEKQREMLARRQIRRRRKPISLGRKVRKSDWF